MANNYTQGVYTPQNAEKYIGKHLPKYRSGWELQFMRMCDKNPSILAWASESHRIPYNNPLTGKASSYVPDFLIVYEDANGKKHAELIEIKPSSQIIGNAKTTHDQAHAVVNEAKWQMARLWCKKQGLEFRIITENEMFRNQPKRASRRKR
jgi:hypothetical protein